MDEVWPHAAQLFLTFTGMDGKAAVFGASGDVGYNAHDEDTITGTLRYHHGDDLPFVWKRVKQKPSGRKRARK